MHTHELTEEKVDIVVFDSRSPLFRLICNDRSINETASQFIFVLIKGQQNK